MQTTSTRLIDYATGQVRPLSWGVRASFSKEFDVSTTFFTLEVSLLDGIDILAPSDDNPVQEWDRYSYQTLDDRVMSIEVVREELEPYSVTQAYADITLNNYDSYFTPNSGSPIQDNILPRRPFRALMGFGNENLSQMVGLSQGMPTINKSDRTAQFHIIDFMTWLFDKDISESIILEDVRTDEILDYLLQLMGLSDTQYFLDLGINTIPFFWVEKGTKFGGIVSKLMEAEIGRLYLDEQGIVRFKNRYNYNLNSVYRFDKSNTIDYSLNDDTKIINSVKVVGDVREVQSEQSIWTSSVATSIVVGESIEVWADFQDPVTTITNPTYSATEINDSYFTSNLNEDGTGTYTNVSLTSLTLFSKSALMVFSNTGASDAYITAIDLYGTPAKVVEKIKVEEVDQDSIDKYEEQLYEVDNDYIQDRSNAQSLALTLLNGYSEYGTGVDIDVKGNPALQLNDAVELDLDGYQGDFVIMKTTNIMSEGKFTQRLRVRAKEVVTFFTLDVSVLDGTDLLSP